MTDDEFECRHGDCSDATEHYDRGIREKAREEAEEVFEERLDELEAELRADLEDRLEQFEREVTR